MTIKTTKFDVSEYLDDEETILAYLEECLEEGDINLFQKALGDVAKAKGMTAVARDAGIAREALYRALSETGNPAFATIVNAMKPLGFRLSVEKIAA